MVQRTRFTALLLALTLLLSLPVSAAEQSSPLLPKVRDYPDFADVAGTWCEAAVKTCYETGLMDGRTSVQFDRQTSLTYAQITVITARLQSLLNGGDGILPAPTVGEAWYQPAADALLASNLEGEAAAFLQFRLKNYMPAYAAQGASRYDFVQFLAAILPDSALVPMNHISAVPDESDTAVLAFYQAGILSGLDQYGTFAGGNRLSRGEAAAMLARVLDSTQRLTFTLTSFDLCRDVLGLAPDTVLLTLNGKPVTAELFASQLTASLREWGGDSTDKALVDAIRLYKEYTASFFALAKISEVSLTEAEQEATRLYGEKTSGFLGLSAAYYQTSQQKLLLNRALEKRYIQRYGEKAAIPQLHQDLAHTAAAMLEECAPALTAFDLQALYARAIAAPF